MKMAKASEADIDMAIELANVLEDIQRGCFPSKFNNPEIDDIEWLVTDKNEQYQGVSFPCCVRYGRCLRSEQRIAGSRSGYS